MSETILREQSRTLRRINKLLCCVTEAVENGDGNSVFLQGLFSSGTSEMGLLTITADNAGTYTSITDDGASGVIELNVNAGGYVPFSSPLVLIAGDTINVNRTITTSDGWYKLTGTY